MPTRKKRARDIIDTSTLRLVCAETGADPRTVDKVLLGEPVRGSIGGRVLAFLQERGLAPAPRTVPVDPRARRAYPWLAGIVFCAPGLVIEDESSGTRVRVREDGGLDEILPPGHPQPGAAFDPTNARGARHG